MQQHPEQYQISQTHVSTISLYSFPTWNRLLYLYF